MRRLRTHLLTLCAFCAPGVLSVRTPLAAARPPQAGDRGVGYTVFSGQKVDTFQVEILGRLERWGTTGDVLLARLSGDPLTQTGVLEGMSGSPVLIDGELIGAVMATWGFAKEPIAAIRPIADMRRMADALERGEHPTWKPGDQQALAPSFGAPAGLALGDVTMAGGTAGAGAAALAAADGALASAWSHPPLWPHPQVFDLSSLPSLPALGGAPVEPPHDPAQGLARRLASSGLAWTVSGFAPAVRSTIAQALDATLPAAVGATAGADRAAGLDRSVVVSSAADVGGAGPAASASAAGALQHPGDAMAVLLVYGDARLGAVGTMTERIGDTVLGFGHPLLGAGPLSLPLAGASVVALLPSSEISFKFATAGPTVGALLLDRSTGVCGRIGVTADLLPVHVRVVEQGGREDHFSYGVAREPAIMTTLVLWTIQSALLSGHENLGESTVRMQLRLDVPGEPPVVSESAFSGLGQGADLASEVILPISMVAFNDEQAVRLQAVQAQLELGFGEQTARLGRVLAQPPDPRPGQRVAVRVELLPRHAAPVWTDLEITVPPRTQPGLYELHLADGSSAFREELARAMARWRNPGVRAVREAFALRRPASTLVATLYGAPQAVVVRGRELEQLPPSVQAVLGRARGTPTAESVLATPVAGTQLTTQWVLDGAEKIAVTVRPAESK